MTSLIQQLAGPRRLSWRRPFFGVLFLGTATTLCVLGYLDGEQWTEFSVWLGVFVFAGEAVPATVHKAPRAQEPA